MRGEKGLHSSVKDDVEKVLEVMSLEELEERYQTRIKTKMQSGEAKVVEFWSVVALFIKINNMVTNHWY